LVYVQAAAKVYAMVKDLQAEKEESLKVISVLQKNAQIERQKAEAAAGVAKKAIEGLKTVRFPVSSLIYLNINAEGWLCRSWSKRLRRVLQARTHSMRCKVS
jgi:isocitrate dehydrogenase